VKCQMSSAYTSFDTSINTSVIRYSRVRMRRGRVKVSFFPPLLFFFPRHECTNAPDNVFCLSYVLSYDL
jgi:hypothetical protein